MRFKGVLFDLFGTLVPPFSLSAHSQAMRACADVLGLTFEAFQRRWVDSSAARMGGYFPSIATNLEFVARDAGVRVSDDVLARAENCYEAFTTLALMPVPGSLETINWFRTRGVRPGLITNCAPDVPKVLEQTSFAGCFDAVVCSCLVKAIKPSDAIYRAALEALRLPPEDVLYVGDGSDQELTGARRNGLCPVLVRVDHCDTYDTRRPDVQQWGGPAVDALGHLPALAASL